MHKNNLKWFKDFNVRQAIIKFLQENTGKTFCYINLTNVFSGQSPKATEIRAKINQWDLINLTNVFLRPVSQSNKNKSKNEPMGPNQTNKFCTAKETQKKPKRQRT